MFLKHAIALVILGVAALGLCAQANTVHDTELHALQLQVEQLKGQAQLNQQKIALETQAMKDDIQRDREDAARKGWIIVIVGVVGFFGGWLFVFQQVRNSVRNRMETKITEAFDAKWKEVESRLDASKGQLMEKVESAKIVNQNLIREQYLLEREHFLGVVARYGMEQQMRNQKRLLILVEREDRKQRKEWLFKQVFQFPQVTVEVFDPNRSTSDFDMVIFDREEGEGLYKADDFQLLKTEAINKYCESHAREGELGFLYFGPYDRQLEVRYQYFSAANSTFTAFARIMEIFGYFEMLGKVK